MVLFPQTKSSPLQRTFNLVGRRPSLVLITVFILFLLFVLSLYRSSPTSYLPTRVSSTFDGVWNSARDSDNLVLTPSQCVQAFPSLTHEIERSASHFRSNPITPENLSSIPHNNGYVRALIYNQSLYLLDKFGGIYSREFATLSAIHRAIVSSPIPLPNIEFVINTDDIVFEAVPVWTYARRKQGDEHIWLIPDFGFWSWPETKVGSFGEVRAKVHEVEFTNLFARKDPRVLWRGATMGLPLRDQLVSLASGKSWADVQSLDWHPGDGQAVAGLKTMSDHCAYKYLAHTEGNSYSGRLKYLQLCESVIMAHEMSWVQHVSHLMVNRGKKQNYVDVGKDWSALEEAVMRLEADQEKVRGIAKENVRVFRDRYLTPAAEVCYWRALIARWRDVSFEPEFYESLNGQPVWRGVPWESFLLERRLDWDPY